MSRKFSKCILNYYFIFWFSLSIFSIIFFPSYNLSASTQVTLEWSPNTEPDLAGYRIFYREEGQSFDYTTPSWEGINISCTIYDLDENKKYYFVARAFDNDGLESGDSAVVILEARATQNNQPPIANAGPEQTVEEGRLVTLDGSNSTDPDDDIMSYQWVQTDGYMLTLSDSDGQKPTFTAPGVGPAGDSLTFELTVVDHNGNQSTDSCIVNVTWLNVPPQADAGIDQTVDEGVVVTLEGSASLDIDDGISSYSWNQTSGPAVTLSNPASAQSTFTALNVGPEGASLAFNITVEDAGGLKDTDSCIVNVSWQNASPTAVIAEDYIEVNEKVKVTMDGSGSTDPDDGIASYNWKQVEGIPVVLSDPGSAQVNFIAPDTNSNGGNMVFQLTVKDSGGLQSSAGCNIYVTDTVQTDNVTILSVHYNQKRRKLNVQASSDALRNSVTLTAWANYDNESVKLGDLKYSFSKKIYRKTFRNYATAPYTVTVKSSGGGSDTK